MRHCAYQGQVYKALLWAFDSPSERKIGRRCKVRLQKARITNYRSIKDSGWVEFERDKTIMVGPNEAGKSAFLKALQQINPPVEVPKFEALRDYPRQDYNDITAGRVIPATTTVAEAHFSLEDSDKAIISAEFHDTFYVYKRHLDNSAVHDFVGGPPRPTIATIEKDLRRMAAHVDNRLKEGEEKSTVSLDALFSKRPNNNYYLQGEISSEFISWLEKYLHAVDEADEKEEARYAKLLELCRFGERRKAALDALRAKLPIFVLFSNYYRVKPLIHLAHLATRVEQKLLDDDQYDYGNQCLLNLLGFTARNLSDLGRASEPSPKDAVAHKNYRD